MGLRADPSQRLVALCLLGCLLLSYPLLALFNRPVLVWGLPLVYLYLLGAWALLIALAAWITRRGDAPRPSEP